MSEARTDSPLKPLDERETRWLPCYQPAGTPDKTQSCRNVEGSSDLQNSGVSNCWGESMCVGMCVYVWGWVGEEGCRECDYVWVCAGGCDFFLIPSPLRLFCISPVQIPFPLKTFLPSSHLDPCHWASKSLFICSLSEAQWYIQLCDYSAHNKTYIWGISLGLYACGPWLWAYWRR